MKNTFFTILEIICLFFAISSVWNDLDGTYLLVCGLYAHIIAMEDRK